MSSTVLLEGVDFDVHDERYMMEPAMQRNGVQYDPAARPEPFSFAIRRKNGDLFCRTKQLHRGVASAATIMRNLGETVG